ncbi:MAG: hydantoinase B/oxoprolinase family protein [Acidimicrobiia bacterium]
MAVTTPTKLDDAITTELVRHRLITICENAVISLARVSGSPTAVEGNDLNTMIMDRAGGVIVCGHYVLVQISAMSHLVRYIAENYADDPGIGPGDMFLCNDPYIGTIHQPDVSLVAPVHYGGEVVAWVGAVVHQLDVGGPFMGRLVGGVADIFEEALPTPPVRIVEADRIRKDIEAVYVRRSRVPDLLALELRGQVAANRTARTELQDLCDEHGADTLTSTMDRLVSATSAQFGRRLADLPDGTWREECYHDGVGNEGDEPTAIRVTMHKRGDHLELDFTETTDQVAGPINATRIGTQSVVTACVLSLLGYRLPWTVAGFWRNLTLTTRPGSIVDCIWPSGTSIATTVGTSGAIRTCVNAAVARMLDSSDSTVDDVMACGMTAGARVAGHAVDRSGRSRELGFEAGTWNGLAGGSGARGDADGLDTGGMISTVGLTTMNIETQELASPVIYLTRRELADSGGPGAQRGGVGSETISMLIDDELRLVPQTLKDRFGVLFPSGFGSSGGEPGHPGAGAIIDGDLGVELGAGSWVDVDRTRALIVTRAPGGGGFGDPLDREPEAVLRDVLEGLVSAEAAGDTYGVALVVDGGTCSVDVEATAAGRHRRRSERIGRDAAPAATTLPGRRISRSLRLVEGAAGAAYACSRCAVELGPLDRNVKESLLLDEQCTSDVFPLVELAAAGEVNPFVLRRYHCPSCGSQVDTELSVAGRPMTWSVDPRPSLG